MFHYDFIARLIEQLSLLLMELNRLKRAQQFSQALQAVENTLLSATGLGIVSVRFTDALDLMRKLVRFEGDAEGRDRAMITARLLSEIGGIYLAQDRMQEHCDFQRKSLELILQTALFTGKFNLPEFAPKVEDLVGSLSACEVPTQTRMMLMKFYEAQGDYARAEDALFDARDTHPDDEEVQVEGAAFFERLLQLNDARLSAGNLPREEVESDYREFAQSNAE
ncbi:MAG TPA: DUF6483 family protein [Thermoflexales bacterium]|nr:DUF6483 family protein [Thermoflexales bacterium]HQW35185.1 DUF6483 family protein [Thermoflexales bacterium]HQX74660.1 DUF6483 family protein [Thermoflexales bacterium]HQZ98892.1 DUF6483 family protein [Thermoflexales bacterium]